MLGARIHGSELGAEIHGSEVGATDLDAELGAKICGSEVPATSTSPRISCCARPDISEPRSVPLPQWMQADMDMPVASSTRRYCPDSGRL